MSNKETLTTRIGCLVSQEHSDIIAAAAKDQGLSVSAFIRVACLEKARASIPLRGEVR